MDTVTRRLTRAAIWSEAGVRLRDVELPEPGRGELLVRVDLATVCGSDLHTVSGRRAAPSPSILGHEAVGRVVAAGPDAGREIGERVVWSVTAACGRCARCRRGFTAKCARVRKVGHEAFTGDWPLSGGYAEHILLPAGVGTVAVPDEVPDAVAAPAGCATATVMAALEAAGELSGRRVLVCGAGMLGITAVAACADRGAQVRITDPHRERRDLARRFGAAADNGGLVDIAFDFSGSTAAVAAALGRLDLGGTLVLAGCGGCPAPTGPIPRTCGPTRWISTRPSNAGARTWQPARRRVHRPDPPRGAADRFRRGGRLPTCCAAVGTALDPRRPRGLIAGGPGRHCRRARPHNHPVAVVAPARSHPAAASSATPRGRSPEDCSAGR